MAIVSFGQALPYPVSCPLIIPDLPQIAGPQVCEVWTSDRPVQFKTDAGISTAMNGECLIGSISLDEESDLSLDAIAYKGYREVLLRLQDWGYPYLWRVWNYFPRINEDRAGLEQYRRFCVGRHQALSESLYDFPFSLPAATAVGTRSGPLQVMFLAGTRPATHLGNPRQVNAYEYPSEYGPRSPSFARATLLRSEQDSLLFIAGTASIVGHTSRHIGRSDEQTRESVQNLLAVLAHAASTVGTDVFGLPEHAVYKVYVRGRDSLDEIREALEQSPLPYRRILFLQGDLCRKELLMEIEGIIHANHEGCP
jgi:chorismate lyase/3-hydroxybenzoate synthase